MWAFGQIQVVADTDLLGWMTSTPSAFLKGDWSQTLLRGRPCKADQTIVSISINKGLPKLGMANTVPLQDPFEVGNGRCSYEFIMRQIQELCCIQAEVRKAYVVFELYSSEKGHN